MKLWRVREINNFSGPVYTSITLCCSVLVTETSHDGRYYVGHNEYYEQVLVPKREELMGKLFSVRIVDVSKFSMTGTNCVTCLIIMFYTGTCQTYMTLCLALIISH
jgi:hypothetical protein